MDSPDNGARIQGSASTSRSLNDERRTTGRPPAAGTTSAGIACRFAQMSLPLVSICIPTFNYARFLGDAISSAQAQSYAITEIIVVDNCSTDETPEVVGTFARRDSRIRYHRNEQNIGMQGNFNRCLRLAAGRYIKFLCADDWLDPACVERMMEMLESRGNVTLVACRRELADSNMRRLGHLAYSARPHVERGVETIRRCFFRGNLIGEPTAVMFRTSQAKRGFSSAYDQIFDLEMWFHLLERGSFAFIPEPLCWLRQHQAQGTRGNLGSTKIIGDRRRIFKEFATKPYIRAGLPEKLLWDLRMAWLLCRDTSAENSLVADVSEAVFFPTLLRVIFKVARKIGALRAAHNSR